MCLDWQKITVSRTKVNHSRWRLVMAGVLLLPLTLSAWLFIYLISIASFVTPVTASVVTGACSLVGAVLTAPPLLRIGFHQRKVISADNILMEILEFCGKRPSPAKVAAKGKALQQRIDELLKD